MLLCLLVLGVFSNQVFGHLESEPTCGTTKMDSSRSICCKGLIQDKPSGMPACCGTQALDLNTQICCGYTVNPLPSKTSECCGEVAFDLNLFQCVANQIIPNADHGCPAKYNSYKHICCNGHVFKRDTVTTACCNNLAYDSHTHECCDGVVAAKHHDNHGGCCGKQVYNSDSHLCCSGVLQKRGKGVSVCCGTNLQDAATQVCCNGRIQDKNDETSPGCCQYNMYSAVDHYCCTTTIHKKQKEGYSGCCKDLAVNTKHYECSEGRIVKKFAHNYGTCGQLEYNTQTQFCCRGSNSDVLHPKKTSHERCCGASMIDNKHTCCASGEVRLCGSFSLQAINEKSQMCCDNTVNRRPAKVSMCCNKKAYDPKSESCEDGKVRPWVAELCPRHDTNKFMCCGRQLFQRDPGVTACCGDAAFNTVTHICCDAVSGAGVNYLTVVERPHGVESVGCCGGVAYNSESHICCTGVIHPKGKGNTDCCGFDVMDVNSEICCRGKPHVKTSKHMSCCNEEPYDSDSHICCNGVINPTLTGENDVNACCGSLVYNVNDKVCCQNSIQPRNGLNWACCGTTSYDTNENICCADKTHTRDAHKVCCGKEVINLKDGVCCTGGRVSSKCG